MPISLSVTKQSNLRAALVLMARISVNRGRGDPDAKRVSKAVSLAVDGVEQAQSAPRAEIQESPKFDFGGYRKSDERNTFVNTSRASRLAWIHADLNGAFNIIRKVFGWFHYHSRLNIKHQLMRMSPHCGLSILHLKKNHSLVCGT